jgi:succinate-semialdehyde dehydrogenase/glutarate-semialdehyde dehydrogenase
VAKPPSLTPLSPLEYWRCLFDAGIPAGVINAVTGAGVSVGRQLVKSPLSQKIAFTGSLKVGLDIQQQAKDSVKKISLELGGHCPMIVSTHCDLDVAVKGAVRRSFRNMGQICIAINRIYVHEDIYGAFLSEFKEKAVKLTIADGLEKPDSDLGPMASRQGLEKTKHHVEDALAKGARLICGGKRPAGAEYQKGYFFEPTIVADATHEMLIMTEETFGPAVGVMPYGSLDEAIRLANATPYGLAAYACTNDLHEMHKLTNALEAGSVAVNNVDAGIMNVAYGGWKQSGIGHEHGHEGLAEYLNLKHVRIRYREPS